MRIFKLARRSVGLQSIAYTVKTSYKVLNIQYLIFIIRLINVNAIVSIRILFCFPLGGYGHCFCHCHCHFINVIIATTIITTITRILDSCSRWCSWACWSLAVLPSTLRMVKKTLGSTQFHRSST